MPSKRILFLSVLLLILVAFSHVRSANGEEPFIKTPDVVEPADPDSTFTEVNSDDGKKKSEVEEEGSMRHLKNNVVRGLP
ncbi:MAG: hypothetical protein GF334_08800 [Candidatus Altiarchaeales archaeon]|nr:hypothetical protein [Candidatus Altiarchaeales archaeon]